MGTNRIYHKIAQEILDLVEAGSFPSSKRLPSERALALKFGVSRSCIREAKIVLETHGRLKIKARAGAYVFNQDDAPSSGLPDVESFELIEACALFEAEVAALAAPLITDERILELERLVEIMVGNVKSTMTPDEANNVFHNLIARATNNRVIMLAIDNMRKMRTDLLPPQTILKKAYDKDNSHLEDEYYSILNALKRRNPTATREAMRTHFAHMIEALLAASEEEAYQEVNRKISETRSRFLLSAQLS